MGLIPHPLEKYFPDTKDKLSVIYFITHFKLARILPIHIQ